MRHFFVTLLVLVSLAVHGKAKQAATAPQVPAPATAAAQDGTVDSASDVVAQAQDLFTQLKDWLNSDVTPSQDDQSGVSTTVVQFDCNGADSIYNLLTAAERKKVDAACGPVTTSPSPKPHSSPKPSPKPPKVSPSPKPVASPSPKPVASPSPSPSPSPKPNNTTAQPNNSSSSSLVLPPIPQVNLSAFPLQKSASSAAVSGVTGYSLVLPLAVTAAILVMLTG